MALELLAGPFDLFPLIDRRFAATGNPDPDPMQGFSSYNPMWIDGRGILTQETWTSRHIVQHDGAFGTIGVSRLRSYGHYVLAVSDAGARGYAEDEFFPAGSGRLYALHPVTLAGWEDIGPAAPNSEKFCVRLPDRSWVRAVGQRIERHTGTSWVKEATTLFGGYTTMFFSWGDAAEEFWISTSEGELTSYNWRTRKAGPLLRLGQKCQGVWYSRKHRVFISLHYEYVSGTSGPTRYCTRVWATTPRPAAIVQTITPAPKAGRVSRVSTRVVGSFNDPCPDEVVRWTVPPGYQLVPRSQTTDADGYAQADLIVPMGMSGTGSVTAEVVI